MESAAAPGPAPWWGQVAAFVAALAAWFAIAIINNVAHSMFHVWLTPVPVVTIIVGLVTIRVRSLWPAASLAALVIAFHGYAIALNAGFDTQAAKVSTRLALSWGLSLTGQLAVGALAGWLWYRRESRFARPATPA